MLKPREIQKECNVHRVTFPSVQKFSPHHLSSEVNCKVPNRNITLVKSASCDQPFFSSIFATKRGFFKLTELDQIQIHLWIKGFERKTTYSDIRQPLVTLRVCPREHQAVVLHAISPISMKLYRFKGSTPKLKNKEWFSVWFFSGGRQTTPRFFLVFTQEIVSKQVKCIKLSLQWYFTNYSEGLHTVCYILS